MLPLNRSRNRSRFFGLAVPQSALDLNFLSGTLDPRITFTRASSGTFFGSNGLLQTASNDVPRFDYDPVTRAARGLLIEEQRTNLLLYNRDLTDVTWVKTNITAVRNQVGIDGAANTATRLTAGASNGTVLQTITSASAARAISAYVRRVTGTGAVEMTQDNGVTWTAITVPITWGRVTIPSTTVTNPTVGFRIVTSGDAIDVDYCQCENGAFTTSAIATTITAATRLADRALIMGTDFSSWFNPISSTIYAEWTNIASTLPATFQTVVVIDDASITNFYRIFQAVSSARVSQNMLSGGANPGRLDAGNTYSNTVTKAAAAFAALDRAITVDGLPAVASATGALPVSVTQMSLGSTPSTTTNFLNGHIRRIVYWPVRVPNTQLQLITA